MSDLSVVQLQRIVEYQRVIEYGGSDEEVEDAAEKLRALNIDPDLALHLPVKKSEVEGDR